MKLTLLKLIAMTFLTLSVPLSAFGQQTELKNFVGSYKFGNTTATLRHDNRNVIFSDSEGTELFTVKIDELVKGFERLETPNGITEVSAAISKDEMSKILIVTNGWDQTRYEYRIVNYGPSILYQQETIQYRWIPIYGWYRTHRVGYNSINREYTKVSNKNVCEVEL